MVTRGESVEKRWGVLAEGGIFLPLFLCYKWVILADWLIQYSEYSDTYLADDIEQEAKERVCVWKRKIPQFWSGMFIFYVHHQYDLYII